jgi:hypothetical protein
VVSGSNGAFTVTGGHTYADEGSFPLGVTITDKANNTNLPLNSGTVAVAEADVLAANGLTFTANLGQAFSGTVATFTDSDTSNVASDFNATINWGDGTTTPGVITDTAGVISVSGTHTYGSAGRDAVTVTLTEDAPGTATATGSSTANVAGLAGLAGQTSLTAAKEGVALPSTTRVATFTDTNRRDTASSFTATINWGDGTTTSGKVTGSNGAFTVTGGYTFADEGSFPLGVTVTDKANNTSLPLSGTVAVAETDVLSARGLSFSAKAGQAFSGKVATFTDRNTSNVASDFSATINWGDGTATAGVITDSRGTISVSGTHTYASSGRDAVTVTLVDDAPGTATATAQSSATVAAGTTAAFVASANSADSSGPSTVTDGQHAQSASAKTTMPSWLSTRPCSAPPPASTRVHASISINRPLALQKIGRPSPDGQTCRPAGDSAVDPAVVLRASVISGAPRTGPGFARLDEGLRGEPGMPTASLSHTTNPWEAACRLTLAWQTAGRHRAATRPCRPAPAGSRCA